MTHSIWLDLLAILMVGLFASSLLWGAHHHPWGKRDARVNYVMGTLGMLIPYTMLLLFWALKAPVMNFALAALLGLWVVVALSGTTVHVLYEQDEKRDALTRARAAEFAERVVRT